MNHITLASMFNRLSHPTVIISLVSHVVQILVLAGVDVNQKAVLSIITAACSIFVTLGVLSNPDTENQGYGDDMLICSESGQLEKHVKVAGQLICQPHGKVYKPSEDTSENATENSPEASPEAIAEDPPEEASPDASAKG